MAGFFSRSIRAEGGGGSEGAWKPLLSGLRSVGYPQIEVAARELLIPMGVLPKRFVDNLTYLDVQGMEFMLPPGAGKLNITPSVKGFMRTMDRPVGQSRWFLAAFPDVAEWASTIAHAKPDAFDARLRKLANECGVSEDDEVAMGRLLDGPDGGRSPMFCRMLVEWYIEETGKRLETTIP